MKKYNSHPNALSLVAYLKDLADAGYKTISLDRTFGVCSYTLRDAIQDTHEVLQEEQEAPAKGE